MLFIRFLVIWGAHTIRSSDIWICHTSCASSREAAEHTRGSKHAPGPRQSQGCRLGVTSLLQSLGMFFCLAFKFCLYEGVLRIPEIVQTADEQAPT